VRLGHRAAFSPSPKEPFGGALPADNSVRTEFYARYRTEAFLTETKRYGMVLL
jgi:hypothetical protein